MANMQQAVRRLTVQATEHGVDETARKVRNLGEAYEEVAVKSQKTERATQSMERQLHSVQRRYDQNYRSQHEMARVQRVLNAAEAQGLITAQRKSELLQMASVANDNNARSTTRLESAYQRATNSLRNYLTQMAMLAVASFGLGAIVRTADAATELTNRLRVAGVASSEMARTQEQLYEIANRNGVEVSALGQLYSRASIAANELGASQEQLMQFVSGTAAALRLQGGRTSQASGALLQLSQATGSVIVRAEEFNSILEGALPIAQAAARGMNGMGGSVARLRQEILKGRVTSRQFFEALLKGYTATEAQALGMQLTVGQSLTALNNSWIRFVGAVDSATGASGGLGGAMQGLGSALDFVAQHLSTIISLVRIAGTMLLVAFAPAILTGIVNGLVALGAAGVAAVRALTLAIAANPLGALAVAITTTLVALYEFRDEIKKAIGVDLIDQVRIAANRFIGLFVGAYEAVKEAWGNLPIFFSAVGKEAWNSLVAEFEKPALTINGRTIIPGLDLSGMKSQLTDAQRQAMSAASATFNQAHLQRDYIGPFGSGGAAAPGGAPAPGQKPGAATTQLTAEQEKAKANYDKLVRSAEQFIAMQGIERQSLFMTEEAARALRYEQEMLNKAANDNIKLTPQQSEQLRGLAQQMAEAEAETSRLKAAMDFAKGVTQGFFNDIRQGIAQGQSLWQAFGTAAVNALNKIADKLIQIAIDNLFLKAFGSLLGAGLGGGWMGTVGGTGGGLGGLYANGAAFNRGNVIPFARGGVVNGPTVFPMANGMGLMGEAGPEAVMPLRRGRGGRLGVEMAGGGASAPVNVHVTVGWSRSADGNLQPFVESVAQRQVDGAAPRIVEASVKATERRRSDRQRARSDADAA